MLYGELDEWKDITPIPQEEEGFAPLAPILYSEECERSIFVPVFKRSQPMRFRQGCHELFPRHRQKKRIFPKSPRLDRTHHPSESISLFGVVSNTLSFSSFTLMLSQGSTVMIL